MAVVKILIIHPDKNLLDFLDNYLTLNNFKVKTANNCAEGFTLTISFIPELVIVNKEFSGLDGKGYLIKKSTNHTTEKIPVFLIGDFPPQEIFDFKKMNVAAFLSSPINPLILVERIHLLFNIPFKPPKKTTPMLLDIHVRGKIIIVQIEGNLEADKLEIFNYLIRAFCKQKKISSPRIFIIIPSLYPESITEENVKSLFKFRHFPELEIIDFHVKILTKIPKLVNILKMHNDYAQYEIVRDFIDGLHSLQIDFDKKKTIPVDFLKPGCIYIFDLFDREGYRVIPALTPITQSILDKIKNTELDTLTYYSDFDLEDIERKAEEMELLSEEMAFIDILTSDFEPIDSELATPKILDEKISLFFRKMKGKNVLVISGNKNLYEVIFRALDFYFNIDHKKDHKELNKLIGSNDYIIIFLDFELSEASILNMLRQIRSLVSRRKTSVIILAKHINKISVLRFKESGTDNIVVSPFSTKKILHKVFESVTTDRRT